VKRFDQATTWGHIMKSNLVIVARNEQASREDHYPRTWLVHCFGKSTVTIDVEHDNDGKPFVVAHSAA
jgi:hypothetical protein